MKRKVVSAEVPEPPSGLFSNCFEIDGILYLSGQHAGSANGGVLGDGSPASQMRETLRKIRSLIEAGGGRMNDLVKMTIFLTDMSARTEINAVRREFFTGDMPCATLVGVSALVAANLVVEVDAIAVLGSSTGT